MKSFTMKNISKKQLKKIVDLAEYWGFMGVRLSVVPDNKKLNEKSNFLQIVVKNNKEIPIDRIIAHQNCLLFELTELLGCKIILLTEKELYPQDLKNINKYALHLNKPQKNNELEKIIKVKFTSMNLSELFWKCCIEKKDVEGFKKEWQKNTNDKKQSFFVKSKEKSNDSSVIDVPAKLFKEM